MTAFADPVFQAFTLAVAIIVIALYAIGFLTAKRRAERKVIVNHEDITVTPGATVADTEHPDVQRLKRAHLNLIESAVPFFAIGLLYTFTGPSATLARVLFAAFVVARLFHVVSYVGAKQPLRTAMFAVGALANVVMVVQVLRTLLPAMF